MKYDNILSETISVTVNFKINSSKENTLINKQIYSCMLVRS